ncbi:MAG TPA: hypothetical protein EYH58_02755 [Aquifex aeolicus]|nr:hypothetical protein [Aquifex aeolicus]
MKIIYSLVGNLPSRHYDLIEWYNHDDKQKKYKFPLSVLAYAKELKDKGENYKIIFLVPHSIFKDVVNDLNQLGNVNKLKEVFKEDILNYYSNRLKSLIDEINKAKNKDKFTDSTGKLISFLKKVDEVDTNLLKKLEEFKELEQIEELEEAKNDFTMEWKGIQKEVENILNKKDKKLREIINSTNMEIEVIPSLGAYRSKVGKINYKIRYSQRVLKLLLRFVKDILNHLEDNTHFILDVSTGLNALVVEAVESFYNANVFSNFFFITQNPKHKFSIFSAEPVIGADNTVPKAYRLEGINKRAFLQKPFNYSESENIINHISKEIDINRTELRVNLEQSIFLFNIIFYNIPLCITLPAYDSINLELKSHKNMLDFTRYLTYLVEKKLRMNFSKNNEGLTFKLEPNLEFKKVRDLLFMLMLGVNITKSFESIGLFYLSRQKDLSLSDLRKFFDLYERYNLKINEVFLEKELDTKSKLLEILNENEKITLKEANCRRKNISKKDDCNKVRRFSNDDIRNFLAHCGFHDCSTYVCRKNNTLFFSLKERLVEKIRDTVLGL